MSSPLDSGQAEICQLDRLFGKQHEILGFDVPMQDFIFVGVGHSTGHLHDVINGRGPRNASAQAISQRFFPQWEKEFLSALR